MRLEFARISLIAGHRRLISAKCPVLRRRQEYVRTVGNCKLASSKSRSGFIFGNPVVLY